LAKHNLIRFLSSFSKLLIISNQYQRKLFFLMFRNLRLIFSDRRITALCCSFVYDQTIAFSLSFHQSWQYKLFHCVSLDFLTNFHLLLHEIVLKWFFSVFRRLFASLGLLVCLLNLLFFCVFVRLEAAHFWWFNLNVLFLFFLRKFWRFCMFLQVESKRTMAFPWVVLSL